MQNLPDRLEHRPKLVIVLLLEVSKLSRKVLVTRNHFPELHKGPHDRDIDLNRLGAP